MKAREFNKIRTSEFHAAPRPPVPAANVPVNRDVKRRRILSARPDGSVFFNFSKIIMKPLSIIAALSLACSASATGVYQSGQLPQLALDFSQFQTPQTNLISGRYVFTNASGGGQTFAISNGVPIFGTNLTAYHISAASFGGTNSPANGAGSLNIQQSQAPYLIFDYQSGIMRFDQDAFTINNEDGAGVDVDAFDNVIVGSGPTGNSQYMLINGGVITFPGCVSLDGTIATNIASRSITAYTNTTPPGNTTVPVGWLAIVGTNNVTYKLPIYK